MARKRSDTRDWSLFRLEVPPAGRIAYPLHVSVWEPDRPSVLTMDVHQGLEIGIVLRGQMERHYEDLTFIAKAGDVHLCSSWEPHGWRAVTPHTSSVAVIFLPEALDDQGLRGVPWVSFFTVPPVERPRTVSGQMRGEVVGIGERLRHESLEQPVGWLGAARALVTYLLLTVNRYWTAPRTASPHPRAPASSFARVMPAVELVHRDPAVDVSFEEAAAACGLHRSRFSGLFRQTMGVSFGQFRRRARLAQVAHLLLISDLPMEAIAEETGFTDGSHLHRTFVHNYGYTPGNYRAMHRPGSDGSGAASVGGDEEGGKSA